MTLEVRKVPDSSMKTFTAEHGNAATARQARATQGCPLAAIYLTLMTGLLCGTAPRED